MSMESDFFRSNPRDSPSAITLAIDLIMVPMLLYTRRANCRGGERVRRPFLAVAIILLLMAMPVAGWTGDVTSTPVPSIQSDIGAGSRSPPTETIYWLNETRVTFNDESDLRPELAVTSSFTNLVTWNRSGQQYIEWIDAVSTALAPEKPIVKAFPPVQHSGQPIQSMALNDSSYIHLISTADGLYDPTYCRFLADGSKASVPTNLSLYEDRPRAPCLAQKAQDKVFVAYECERSDSVGVALFDNGTLQNVWKGVIQNSVGHVLGVDVNTSVCLLTRYPVSGTGLHYSRYSSKMSLEFETDIETPVNGSGLEVPMPALALGPDGSMHLLQASRLSGARTLYYTMYDRHGKKMTDNYVLTTTAADFGDIAADGHGNIYFAWGDSSDKQLYYAHLPPGQGSKPPYSWKLTHAIGPCHDPSIAIDPSGMMSVAWVDERDGNPEIYFRAATLPAVKLAISAEDSYKLLNLPPGVKKTVNVTVSNWGRMAETVSLDIVTDGYGHESWNANLSTRQLQLGPAESRNVRLNVTAPSTGSPDQYVDININASISVIPFPKDSLSIRSYLTFHPGFRIGIPEHVHSLQAADTTVFSIHVINIGDVPLDINLTTRSPPDWVASLNQSVVRNLRPGQYATVCLYLTSPAWVYGDDKVTVIVEGRNDAYNLTEKNDVTAVISTSLLLKVLANRTEAKVDPGSTARYQLTYELHGNLRNPVAFQLDIPSAVGDWNASLSQDLFSMHVDYAQTVELAVTAPWNASVGDRLAILIRCQNEEGTLVTVLLVNATVGMLHRLEVTALPGLVSMFPGAESTAYLRVCNTGNLPDVIFPGPLVPGDGWGMHFERSDGMMISVDDGVPIYRNGTVVMNCIISAPEDSLAGGHSVNGSLADSNGNIYEFQLVVNVRQLHALALGAPVPKQAKKAGGIAFFDLTLVNRGNGPDNATFSVHGLPPGWQALIKGPDGLGIDVCPLPIRGAVTLNLSVFIFAATPLLNLSIDVFAESPNGARAGARLVVDLLKPDLSISSFEFPRGEVKFGKPQNVNVTVINNGTADADWLPIAFFGGKDKQYFEWREVLQPGQCHTFSFVWVPAPGKQTLSWTVDPSYSINELNETNNKAEIFMYLPVKTSPRSNPIVTQAAVALIVCGLLLCAAALISIRKPKPLPHAVTGPENSGR